MIEPMDNERKIEKLLRAYAKKRRADASDPLKLHPSARRRLQDEVARQFAEPPEEESISLWQLFRQQWAFLLMFTFVLFFGASLLMPALSKAKYKAKSAVAMNNLRQIGAAAQIAAVENNGRLPATLDALTNGYLSREALNDPQSGKPFVYAAGGERLDDLKSNSVLAYSPEDKKSRAILLADGQVEKVSAKDFDEFTRRGLVQREPAAMPAGTAGEIFQDKLAINTPAPGAPSAAAPIVATGTLAVNNGNVSYDERGGSAGGGGGAGGTTFGLGKDSGKSKSDVTDRPGSSAISTDNTLAAAQPAFRFKAENQSNAGQSFANNNSQRFVQNKAINAKTSPVLADFEVRQNGNAIVVVDNDGSVYSGTFEPMEIPVAQTTPSQATPPAEQNRDYASQTKNEVAAAQNNIQNNSVFFRVAGQNRTTKQNVVFAGNVISLANLNANNSNRQKQQQPAATLANSCIMGTATIGGTNTVEINAVPVAP